VLAGFEILFTGKTSRKITPYQKGGLVTSPTLALLGEAGPELVLPLKSPSPITSPITKTQNFEFNNVINVNANVSSDMDISSLADKLDRELYERFRRRYYR